MKVIVHNHRTDSSATFSGTPSDVEMQMRQSYPSATQSVAAGDLSGVFEAVGRLYGKTVHVIDGEAPMAALRTGIQFDQFEYDPWPREADEPGALERPRGYWNKR